MSYLRKYYSRSDFYFKDHSSDEYENMSAKISESKPARSIVSEMCYRYNLKILNVTDPVVTLCTPRGIVVAQVTRNMEQYQVSSPFIMKERGERYKRSYNNLRALMNTLREDMPMESVCGPDAEEKLFKQFYSRVSSRLAERRKNWLDSHEGRRETNRLREDRWTEPLLTFKEQLMIINSVFLDDLSMITNSPKFQQKYKEVKAHMKSENELFVGTNNLLKRSLFFQLCGVYDHDGKCERDDGILMAELSFNQKNEDYYEIDSVKNVFRARNLESYPEALANFTMLKTAIGSVRYGHYEHYYHDFEMSCYWDSGTIHSWEDIRLSHSPAFLTPLTLEVTQ